MTTTQVGDEGVSDELEEARAIVRELIAVCPIYALPLELMWRLRDTPRLSWAFPEVAGTFTEQEG